MSNKSTGRRQSNRAVSPVIGVILMVAITVILAAVIGTFVMGMSNNVHKNAQAGIAFDQAGNNQVDIQLTSLGNVNGPGDFNITSDCTNVSPITFSSVGNISTATGCNPGDKITVIATVDGKKNVVTTYEVN